MRMLLILASSLAIAGCSQAEDEEPAPVVETSTPEPTEPLAADGNPAPGLYRITLEDGTVFTEDVRADGTYVQTDADGEVVETGTWEQKSPQQYCYTVDEEYREAEEPEGQQCNTEGIGEDGVWFSTNPEGETSTVERSEG